MKRATSSLLFLSLALVAAGALWPQLCSAAGGGEVHMSMSDILWDMGLKVLNVTILGFFAYKLLAKPLNSLTEARSERVRQELEEAKAGRRDAEEQLKVFQDKMAKIDGEIDELRKLTCVEIDQEQKLLLEESRQAAEHIRQHAQDTIRQEVAKAREELHQEAAHLAIELAEELISKNITSDDRNRLVAGYLKEMEAQK